MFGCDSAIQSSLLQVERLNVRLGPVAEACAQLVSHLAAWDGCVSAQFSQELISKALRREMTPVMVPEVQRMLNKITITK